MTRWVVLFRIPRKTKTSHLARLLEERCLTVINAAALWTCELVDYVVWFTSCPRKSSEKHRSEWVTAHKQAGWEKVHLRWINLHGSAVTSHDPGLKPAPRTVRRKARLLLTVSDWSCIRVGCTPRSIQHALCYWVRPRTRSPRTINHLISSAAVPHQLFHWSGVWL